MTIGAIIFGLVAAPMGWILTLAMTGTPQWREFSQRPGFPQDVSFSDGLWGSCMEVTSIQAKICKPIPEEMAISWLLQMMRTLTLLLVLVGFLSYVLTHLGTRWWSHQPNYCLTRGSGLFLMLSGVLYLCITSYMAYRALANIANPQSPTRDSHRLGTCLHLGWAEGAAETSAGMCLMATNFHSNRLQDLPLPYRVDY